MKNESFPQREERILNFWSDNAVFEKSLDLTKDGTPYIFYDGPPFATGLPHYGHLLAGTIKDVIPRFKTMKGYHVPRRFGWDCHGLPIEQEIEKSFQLSGSPAINEFGMARFNEECRKIVLRYTNEWQKTVLRMGRWVSFKDTYKTMDTPFMESVWWVFSELYRKGLIYEGFKVMPYSAKLGTPLSNFEAGENYKDVDDPALTVTFPLRDNPSISLLAWTTTPWTLPSNMALMVGPTIDYVQILDKEKNHRYILAQSRLSTVYKDAESYEIEKRFTGKDLAGLRYTPIFTYFKELENEGAFQVILEPSVSLDEGVGIVHAAPAFGEVDFYACKGAKIPFVCPVDANGLFTQEIPEFKGVFVKEADSGLIRMMKANGRVFHHATLHHRYPFCWRSDTPLIYKAVNTWFVSVESIKEALLASNQQIYWMPSFIKEGRFGKWLEGARDWAISRNRFWGTPIPIYRSESGKIHVVQSIQELETLTGKKITDLHRHFIDDLTFQKEGEAYKRIPEVFDCWFESGSMPYAQEHYPFENKELFEKNFPADFIAEGLDQTRGWFYTLTVLSTALFNKPAFKNVIVNGIILAEDGNKMSKRLKNYPDPQEMINTYGADAIRLYMLMSPAVLADSLNFTKGGVELVLRQVLIPLWNAAHFFHTYADIYHFNPKNDFKPPKALLDRWIISLFEKLVKEVDEALNSYNLQKAVEPLVDFVDQLTNWYIRRSRRRFWNDAKTDDRDEAFSTLYQVLKGFTEVAAPFIPFLTEALYQRLKSEGDALSVHLRSYPDYNLKNRDGDLEESMKAVQTVVSMGHALRKTHKLKVRQPLGEATIATKDPLLLERLKSKSHLIEDELNVKSIRFTDDEASLVSMEIKPNFRILGKRAGAQMPLLQKAIMGLTKEQQVNLKTTGSLTVDLGGTPFTFTTEEVSVEPRVLEGAIAASSEGMTIGLTTTLNDALILEGIARELVNKINTMRRDLDFEVTDRIRVVISPSERIQASLAVWKTFIAEEVLATDMVLQKNAGDLWDLNGEEASITIERV